MKRDAVKVGLLGMGTVGTGVVRVLCDNAENISRKVGVPIKVEKVLVRNLAKARNLAVEPSLLTTNAADILDNPDIDIVIELMGGEQPAKEYILTAMQKGKHVVTANKDVVSKHGKDLFDMAAAHKVDFQFEASVGGGIPIIRPLKQCLAGNRIQEIIGIVNGTTNYMLTKMSQEGCDFHAVLKEAQEKGYAEADPTADVEGLDAARKIAILASIAFSSRVVVDDVYVEGITPITPRDIAYARELGFVIKLLAIAKEVNGQVEVRVHPALIPQAHPLASVNDVFNAIFVKGDAVGETMFYGRGAGELPTASAVVADVIDVARDIVHNISSRILCTCFNNKPLRKIQNVPSSFYIRMLVLDRPGVLAVIAGAFGSQGVSLQSVIQKRSVNSDAELVLVTNSVEEQHLRNALRIIESGDVVREIGNVIRVEGGNLL